MNTTAKSGIIGLLLLLLVLSTLVACGDSDETTEQMPTESPTSEPATTISPVPDGEPTAELPNGEPTAEQPTGDAIAQTNEPPKNDFLADSPWSMIQRNSYCQGSSNHPGPAEEPAEQEEDFLQGRVAYITSNFSSPYPDGKRVIWATQYGEVVKIDPEGDKLALIDKIESEPVTFFPDSMATTLIDESCVYVADFLSGVLPDEDKNLREGEAISGASGIYTVLGYDNILYQPIGAKIIAYGDIVEGDRFSKIEKKRIFEIPTERLPREWDKITGITMTYDGHIAFCTNYSLVGILNPDFTEVNYLLLPDGEYVYNALAADEDGGIYIVSHKAMYRVQWDGEKLSYAEEDGGWRAEYGSGQMSENTEIQSRGGSGSTPSLMGSGNQDKFVVITDGETVMNLMLFWRDEIPADWQQLPGTTSSRVAGKIPVTFGDPNRETSFSDQSVLVRGYGALVVDNKMKIYEDKTLLNTLLGGEPDRQAYGCEKFEWDPETRTLSTAWVNRDVSFPNGIPTMSSATNLIYEVGARNSVWTLEALDWDTGELAWYYEIGDKSRHNSAYAAAQVGPDGDFYYGTFFGLMRIRP